MMPDTVDQLITRFKNDFDRYTSNSSHYTETEVRVEFIDVLFATLGWDMNNMGGQPNSLKDVVREQSHIIEDSNKRPDYTFRISARKIFFVEAKKPSVNILNDKESSYQVRRYGWTAGLPVSILTNFKTLRIYDTRVEPIDTDDSNVALLCEYDYEEYSTKFVELLNLLGRESVATGSIESRFGGIIESTIRVNLKFLDKINSWRLLLASDLRSRYTKLNILEIDDLAQRIINRIIFLRMCEDRGIEARERLREIVRAKDIVVLRQFFAELNVKYNTGLFDQDQDPLQSHYEIDSQLLCSIVEEVYYPKSPFSFSVLDADFLGQVYELFLIKRLVARGRGISLVDKPAYEDREVITTPQPIVDEIVRKTMSGLIQTYSLNDHLTFESLLGMRILDIACGSGRFLISTLDNLVDAAINCLRIEGNEDHLYRVSENEYRLSFSAKKRIAESCLFGIDIDYSAVEVARFSVIIKLLEDETRDTLPQTQELLPSMEYNILWGNSVVESDFLNSNRHIVEQTRPLNWSVAPLLGGFDAIIGNPPYQKTEDMKVLIPHELLYYKQKYSTPFRQFDKYFVFLEQAIRKCNQNGWIGMVISNKWLTTESGAKLRKMFSDDGLISEIVNFGNELLFEGKSTYVCLLVLNRNTVDKFNYRHIEHFSQWLNNPGDKGLELSRSLIEGYSDKSWILPANSIEQTTLEVLFNNSQPLSEVAEIANGIQTSAEDVFAITEWDENQDQVSFTLNGREWTIEKSITRPYLVNSELLVKSFHLLTPDALIIYPYEINEHGEIEFIGPQKMAETYPLALAFLRANKARLARRNVSPPPGRGEFYRYGRHQALKSAFHSPKIVYSVNQIGNKYSLDRTGIGIASGGTAGEVAISSPKFGYSLEFILGLLNQREVEFYLRKRGSPFRGGYYSRGSAVIGSLPVPSLDFRNETQLIAHNDISANVQSMININNEIPAAAGRRRVDLENSKRELQDEIRNRFKSLWGITNETDQLILPGGLE